MSRNDKIRLEMNVVKIKKTIKKSMSLKYGSLKRFLKINRIGPTNKKKESNDPSE